MPLGVTYSNTAADLITGGGKALTDQIRLIGREISAITQRAQTNRDVEALGSELSALDPNQPDYMQKLSGIASRHPMAISSEGGMKLLAVGVEANKGWQREQMLQDKLSNALSVANVRAGASMYGADVRADTEEKKLAGKLEQIDDQLAADLAVLEKKGATDIEKAKLIQDAYTRRAALREIRPIPIPKGGSVLTNNGEIVTPMLPESGNTGGLTTNQRLLSFQKDRDVAKAAIEKAATEIRKITGDDPASGKQKADLWKAIEEWKAKFDAAEMEIQRIRTPVRESDVPGAAMTPAMSGGIPNLPEMGDYAEPSGQGAAASGATLDFIGPMMPTAPAGAKSWKSALQ